jgi:hypothetical protein
VNPEWTWAAGLYEGEGTVSRRSNGWSICLSMTDEPVIRRFHRAVGCGKVYGPYARNAEKGHTPILEWVVSDKAGVDRFIERIQPNLGARRRAQLAPVIEHFSTVTGRRSSCI